MDVRNMSCTRGCQHEDKEEEIACTLWFSIKTEMEKYNFSQRLLFTFHPIMLFNLTSTTADYIVDISFDDFTHLLMFNNVMLCSYIIPR
jgi:hypothetical protein